MSYLPVTANLTLTCDRLVSHPGWVNDSNCLAPRKLGISTHCMCLHGTEKDTYKRKWRCLPLHYWGPLHTSRVSWHFPESVTLPLLASDPWKSQIVIFVFWEFWQIFIKSGVWNVDLGRFFIISTQQVNFIQMIAIYFFIIFFFDLAKLNFCSTP